LAHQAGRPALHILEQVVPQTLLLVLVSLARDMALVLVVVRLATKLALLEHKASFAFGSSHNESGSR
jgi:hypothetical protein